MAALFPADADEPILRRNAAAWDRLAAAGEPLAQPALDAAFADARAWLGTAGPPGRAWLPPNLVGLEVLCLAAGGGRHGPLYAAAGARVTVVDLSPAMLELDRRVARERRLDLELVQTSMDDLGMLAGRRYDLVIQPVSSCYLPRLGRLFAEVARVCRPSAAYISQHKTPASLQGSLEPNAAGRYELLYPLPPADQARRQPLPPAGPSRLRERGTAEFIHPLGDLLGGLCAAGFSIEDAWEPAEAAAASPGSYPHRAQFLPPYLRLLARRRDCVGVRPRLLQ